MPYNPGNKEQTDKGNARQRQVLRKCGLICREIDVYGNKPEQIDTRRGSLRGVKQPIVRKRFHPDRSGQLKFPVVLNIFLEKIGGTHACLLRKFGDSLRRQRGSGRVSRTSVENRGKD